MGVCKQFSPFRYRTFISLERGKFVFQESLSGTPFKTGPGQFFALPIGLVKLSLGFSKPRFWGTQVVHPRFPWFSSLKSPQEISGKEKAHKHKLFGPVALGTPRECPRDKVGLSQGQTQVFSLLYTVDAQFVPGTQTRFVPGTFRGRRAEERVYVLKVYVPFSFPKIASENKLASLFLFLKVKKSLPR